ncbi:hypothetical protein DES53_101149 [Roseimicrobium gellanilyticum]|uniref:Lipoprotein n=1 Tax=Roseimicrobium gellanilyticum TaxID=748857 RepID=A0A366HSW1_9BACT|nr:hypothetical protein [Roseimicrobium gellanilyticum]RBP47352.1 hypothetical protein DES53_101149 [Roseimicrobium gellanilyticum]
MNQVNIATGAILRPICITLAATSLVACATDKPRYSTPPPTAAVLYQATPNVKHVDPPGPHTPLIPEPPPTFAETALHPVARGLAITGRTALVPFAIGGGFIAGRPDASLAMIEAVLTEPLP